MFPVVWASAILSGMSKIYKQIINPETVLALNTAIDAVSDGDNFEMLIPPKTTDILVDFKSTLQTQCPDIVWNEDSFVVTRTSNEGGNRASQCWHFDNFRKTTLIVLKSHNGASNGDILIRNNLRGAPANLTMTMLTKIFWTNPLTWLVLRIPAIRDKFFTRVPLVAGDVMIFDGSTTYHGNLPIASGVRRSILIHDDPVFKDALITKFFHKLCTILFYKK